MQKLVMPETHVLRGDEAIRALEEYVNALNNEAPEGLTESQTRALAKVAKELITALKTQNQQPKEAQQAGARSEKTRKQLSKHPIEQLFSQLSWQTLRGSPSLLLAPLK